MSDEDDSPELAVAREVANWAISLIRCKCGEIINVNIPTICKSCNKHHAYWRDLEGNVKPLSKLAVGHLANIVKILAERVETSTPETRPRLETAMDLVYLEIQSRDKEIAQLSGIGKALGVT